MRKNVFVKVSGDLVTHPDFIKWLKKVTLNNYTVICVGGGTQISEQFEERGWEISFGSHGRYYTSFEQRQLGRDVLERNRLHLEDFLAKHEVFPSVIIPVLDVGGVICPVNGDTMVINAYSGFDKIYIVTLESRVAKKEASFAEMKDKVEVVGLS